MPQIEWFYAKDDQPCGPVSPVELKSLAEKGMLHQDDLVWREGMGEWIPASRIKGLFDANGDGGEGEESPEEVATDQSSRHEVPAGAIPTPPPAAAELPIRSSPIPDREPQNPESQPESSLVAKLPEEVKTETSPLRHPLDALADLARVQFNAHFVHSTIVLLRIAGQYGVFLAIAAILFLAISVGEKSGTTTVSMQLAAAAMFVLLLSQYTASRLFPVLEELDRSARALLSATGPLDCLAWTMTALGLTSLIGLAGFAIATTTAWPAILAIAAFIVCQFTAVVAWNPKAVWLNMGRSTTPGREAAAMICFLGKLLWRLSVVGYGVGIVLGSIATLNVAVHIGLPDAPDPAWYRTEKNRATVPSPGRHSPSRCGLPGVSRVSIPGGNSCRCDRQIRSGIDELQRL